MLDINDIKKEDIGKSIYRLYNNSYISEYKIKDIKEGYMSTKVEIEDCNSNSYNYTMSDNYNHRDFPINETFWTKEEVINVIEEYKNNLRNQLTDIKTTLQYLYDKTVNQIINLSPFDIVDCIDLNLSDREVIKEKLKEYLDIDIIEKEDEEE